MSARLPLDQATFLENQVFDYLAMVLPEILHLHLLQSVKDLQHPPEAGYLDLDCLRMGNRAGIQV
jgi:hypothetical protein